MKRLLTVFYLSALAGVACAETNPLAGSFTHNFTRAENQSVWTVKKAGTAWQVRVHGSNETLRARPVSDAERAAFWEQMWWPADKANDAQCLRIEGPLQGLMCYVQSSTRADVSDLSKNKSDYFYFDQMGGLMEIRRKGT
jgi:hypothetical protein